MAPLSAGILLYQRNGPEVRVLLVRPGGPYWRSKTQGVWMIPKGGVEEGEEPLACAIREFEEELGTRPSGTPTPLCKIRQKGGKRVEAFALEGDLDADAIFSNTFRMEWPPRSGRFEEFPEVERAAWFRLEEAKAEILPSQLPILTALEDLLSAP